MALPDGLLEILACPNCYAQVDYHEAEQVIECRACHYRYPVRDDIPVMLVEEADKPEPPGSGASGPEPPGPGAAEGPNP